MVIQITKERLDVVIGLVQPNVLAVFATQGEAMPFEKPMGCVPLQVYPISIKQISVYGKRRNALIGIVVDVGSVVTVPIVRYPRQCFPLPEYTPVLRVYIPVGIGGLVSRIVEDRTERAGRNLFGARHL